MPLKAVVDTNVVFAGLTRPGSAAGDVLLAWRGGRFVACWSTSLGLEYEDVIGRKLRPSRAATARVVLGSLLERGERVPVRTPARGLSNDPGDDHVIEAAWAAGAGIVTENIKDFVRVEPVLKLPVYPVCDFLKLLRGR